MKIHPPIGKSWKILLLALVLTSVIKSCFSAKDPPIKFHCMSSALNPLDEGGVVKAEAAKEDSGDEWEFTDAYEGDVLSVVGCMGGTWNKIYYNFSIVNEKGEIEKSMKPKYSSYGCDQVTMDTNWKVTCDYHENSMGEDCLSSTVTCLKPLKKILKDGTWTMRIEFLDSTRTLHSRCINIEVTFTPKSPYGYVLGNIVKPDTTGLDDVDCKLYYYFGAVFASLAVCLILIAFLPIQSHPEIEFVEKEGPEEDEDDDDDEDEDDDDDDD